MLPASALLSHVDDDGQYAGNMPSSPAVIGEESQKMVTGMARQHTHATQYAMSLSLRDNTLRQRATPRYCQERCAAR